MPGFRRTVTMFDTFDMDDGMACLCDYDGGSHEFVAFVGDEELAGSDRPLRGFEYGFEVSAFGHDDFDFLIGLAVADFRLPLPRERPVLSEPLPIGERKSVGEEFVFLFVSYDDAVVRHVLRHYVEGVAASNSDVAALADGVEPGARMFAKFLSGGVHDVSRLFRKALPKELAHGDFPDEAEALAVFAFGVGESGFAGNLSNFGFGNAAHREVRLFDLRTVEPREEVCLVFFGIDALKEPGKPFGPVDSRVVSGGDAVESVRERFFEEEVEFDQVVTEDVGIGRNALFVPFVDAADDPVFVFGDEIEGMERNVQVLRDALGFCQVDFGGAVVVVALEVDHEARMHVVPRLFEQVRRNGAVYAAGESYEDFFAVF